MKEITKLLREALPEALGALIASAVLAVIGGVAYLGTGVWLVLLAAGGAIVVTLGCAYVAFSRSLEAEHEETRHKTDWKYPRWRPWAIAALALISTLAIGGTVYYFWHQSQLSDKVIILIADFDGPEQEYGLRKTIWEYLNSELQNRDDIKLERIPQSFEPSAEARAVGENRHGATIIIWGWYTVPGEAVLLSVHFEILHPPRSLPTFASSVAGYPRTLDAADLKGATLQIQLAKEMAYLASFTAGVARYVTRDYDGAVDGFSRALEQLPVNDSELPLGEDEVHKWRGVARVFKSDFDGALDDFDRMIQLKPNSAEGYSYRGSANLSKGDVNQAIRDFSHAIQLETNQLQLAKYYLDRGLAHLSEKDYEQAINDFGQSIDQEPNFEDAYAILGFAYFAVDDYERAIENFNKAFEVRLDHDNKTVLLEFEVPLDSVYYNRGLAYLNNHCYKKAIEDFDQAIRLDSKNADLYYSVGLAYFAQGNYDYAIRNYSRAIYYGPSNAKAYLNRGVT
jgi:tetratricopeptide (TPR) repeat protein